MTHATRIAVESAPPADVAVGSDIELRVRVSCSEGCDLDGLHIEVTAPDDTLSSVRLSGREGADAAGAIAFKAPQTVGQHAWSVAFPVQQIAGIHHEASSASVCIRTKPHATSLAVWDLPTHAVTGQRFTIKVGAKSSADCPLVGQEIEICDETGSVAGRATLQGSPWPGTSGLYWTEVELRAPSNDGLSSWSARLAPVELGSAHDETSSQFHVAVVRPSEHTVTVKVIETVTVKVIEKESAAPVGDVLVRLGAYRGVTDQSGLAQIRVGKGRYDLHIWKVGYEAPARTVDVDDDLAVEIEAVALPPEDPDALWGM
jgi:hypothetical protein